MNKESQPSAGQSMTVAAITETETILRLADDIAVYARAWIPSRLKRLVLCVQGLGGHGGYYRALAAQLAPTDTAVIAPDLRGHGRSTGRRGDIDHFARYLEDIDAAVRWAQERWPDYPLILLGESMGASIALQYLAEVQKGHFAASLAGVALVSPVLRPAIQPSAVEAVRFIRALLLAPARPMLPVTGREELGCRDKEFNAGLRADPLFVRQISARFVFQLTRWLWQTRRAAPYISLPLLILQGERDYIAHPAGTAHFLRRVATQPQLITFPTAYHCLLFDPSTPDVIQALTSWLEQLPAASSGEPA